MNRVRRNGLQSIQRVVACLQDGLQANQLDLSALDPDGLKRLCREICESMQLMAINGLKTQKLEKHLNSHYALTVQLTESLAALLTTTTAEQHAERLQAMQENLAQHCLDLERTFESIIDQDAGVPHSLRHARIQEISSGFARVRNLLPLCPASEDLVNKVERFVAQKDLDFQISRRSIAYMLYLVGRMSKWNWRSQMKFYSSVERFLIYVNFNSKEFMDLLTARIQMEMDGERSNKGKVLKLLAYQKNFNQLHRKADLALNPRYRSLKGYMNNWFENEVIYVSHSTLREASGLAMEFDSPARPVEKKPEKLMCNLSSDQLAIFLRLLDEEQVVLARSLNHVYQTIVPFLSTKNRIDLSPSAVRVKSYYMEDRDRQKVLDILEGMIRRLNSY